MSKTILESPRIPIGISSCLLGQEVRFDGGHKHDRYITGTLAKYFEWIPVCPEVEIGLGTPRATLRFELIDGEPRLWQPKTETDLTVKMSSYAKRRVKQLQKAELYGYILKAKSPSCGMERVKVYRGHAKSPHMNGVGQYAQTLMEQIPNLPVEEEGRLCDPVLRENWINRVFAYYDFKNSLYPRPTMAKLVDYHTKHKFIVLSHCQTIYRELGRLVGNSKKTPIKELVFEYESMLMQALKKRATSRKHVNVLEHMLGFFKKELDSKTRAEILQTIKDYREGFVPVIVPITLIRHYAKLLEVEYLIGQKYLNPHPKELALRSKI